MMPVKADPISTLPSPAATGTATPGPLPAARYGGSLWLGLGLGAAWMTLVWLTRGLLTTKVTELHPFEVVQMGGLLIATGLSISTSVAHAFRGRHAWTWALVCALLGLACFTAAGREIDWGRTHLIHRIPAIKLKYLCLLATAVAALGLIAIWLLLATAKRASVIEVLRSRFLQWLVVAGIFLLVGSAFDLSRYARIWLVEQKLYEEAAELFAYACVLMAVHRAALPPREAEDNPA